MLEGAFELFENRLKKLREEKKLSQRELAEKIGMAQRTYASYENNEREPNSEMLLRLANFFNCSVDYLLGRSDDRVDEALLDIVNEIDDDLLKKYGNVYEALIAQEMRDKVVTDSEYTKIKKYRALDEHGTKAVDSILDIEYERCTIKVADSEEIAENQYRQIQLSLLPASAGFGSFLDGNDSEEISIPVTEEYRQVDFAVRVSGDSMEPDYYDGDIVLVREQPSVEVGEVGLFTIDNMGYIKEQGEDRLISRNPDYDDIHPNEYENVKCWGKVVGALK